MILQSLVRLYERREKLAKSSGNVNGPPPIGFEWKSIPFVIVVDRDGRFVALQDTRRDVGKRKIGQSEMVPAGVKKSVNIVSNFLWGTAEYVIGIETDVKNKVTKLERVRKQHLAFISRLDDIPHELKNDVGVAAVLAFLNRTDNLKELEESSFWETLRTTNPVLSFRLQHDSELVCQREAVRTWWLSQTSTEVTTGLCLVTGEQALIARLHPPITGVWKAHTAGASIVSFNKDAFNSYGKEQGSNAPIGKPAAAMYTTALNELLRDDRHCILIGDASVVFWAEEPDHPIESAFASLFGEHKSDDPALGIAYVKQVYDTVRGGKLVDQRAKAHFYVLALAAPSQSRLTVRFWYSTTVAELSPRFQAHLDDLDIVRPKFEFETPNLFRLLLACATLHKADNIPPNLSGEIVRAVLEGRPYPRTWFAAALRRCHAEQDVDYARAAILKACLNRITRNRRDGGKELTVALDPDNNAPAYLLGQLFMVLERTQEEAMGDINRTIRDTYWNAAQANPQRTFPKLVDLAFKHLKKLRREKAGRAVNLEKLMNDRIVRLGTKAPFPAAFDHEEQGTFIVGYYHQRQSESTYKSSGSKEP